MIEVPLRRPCRHTGLRLLAPAACAFLLGACSLFGRDDDDQPEYYGAVETQPLEIPEGYSRPASDSALVILAPPAPLPQRELRSVPPRVSSTSTNKNENATLRWGSEGAYLLVEDTLESTERRLGFVIRRAGMSMEELTDVSGYRVEYRQPPSEHKRGFFSWLAFWRDDPPDYSGSYRVLARRDGDKTRVYIKNADGSEADPAAAEHLLVILGERLG